MPIIFKSEAYKLNIKLRALLASLSKLETVYNNLEVAREEIETLNSRIDLSFEFFTESYERM